MNNSKVSPRIFQKLAVLILLIVISLFSYGLTIVFKCPYIYLSLPAMIVMNRYLSAITVIIVSLLDEQLLNFPIGALTLINTLCILIYRYFLSKLSSHN